MKLLMVILLLTFSSMTFAFDECYYDETGLTNAPCLGGRAGQLVPMAGAVLYNINEYAIQYMPQHTYSAVKSICIRPRAEGATGCSYIDRRRKTAVVFYVYSDFAVIEHEKDHIKGLYHQFSY